MAMRTLIQFHLDRLILFLDKHKQLATCSLVDYFTKSIYETVIEDDIKNELQQMDYDTVLNTIFNENHAQAGSKLQEYLLNCNNCSLQNIPELCINFSDFNDNLKDFGCNEMSSLKLNAFIKPKKSHEIEILSAIASALHTICKTSHLVDIGDGKGYLSSMLALHYKIRVLGVDSLVTNTSGAVKRVEKLQKVWHAIAIDSKRTVLTKREEKYTADALLYKQITKYVNVDCNLQSLISDVFVEQCTDIGIVGLHTCGDLASTSLQLFANNSYVKSICNVSCCYNLLTESEDNNSSNVGFPMSEYLRRKDFKLGKTARMLSSQSIDRIIFDKKLPNKTIFYRAILQVILQKYYGSKAPAECVGKIKNVNNFLDYYRAAMKKLRLQLDLTDEDIEEYHRIYQRKHREINVFNLLRCMLAPAIESIVLLDRLLYLHERNIANAYLVRLFDPVVSPRCYGVIALKR